jgi:hypothetical protein
VDFSPFLEDYFLFNMELIPTERLNTPESESKQQNFERESKQQTPERKLEEGTSEREFNQGTPQRKEKNIRKKQKVSESLQELGSYFGILILNIPINQTLIEEELINKYACDKVFLPQYQLNHRSTVALLYSDFHTREKNFNSIQRIGAAVVEKIRIEPNSENGFDTFENFLDKLRTFDIILPTNKLKKKANEWAGVRENSRETFAKVIKQVIVAYDSFETELRPSDESLWWYLALEFFIFIEYRVIDLENSSKFKKVIKFFLLKNVINYFLKLYPQNQDYIFETLFQCMLYRYEHGDASSIDACYSLMFDNTKPVLLVDIDGIEVIKNVLKHARVKSLFQKFIGDISYEEAIEKVLTNVYLVDFPIGIHGKTLFNLNIHIWEENPFEGEKEEEAGLGLKIVILLHELGHFFLRFSCTSAKQVVDHDSPLNSFTTQRLKIQTPESGREVEEVLLGEKLDFVTNRSMKWITDLRNWDLKDFPEAFKTENHEKYDEKGREVKKHRMMASESGDSGFVDMSYNWCGTTRKKLFERKLIEESKANK